MIRRLAIAATVALTLPAARVGAQEQARDAFEWTGGIPQGRWLYVRNLNGVIRVERASGSQAEVRARVRTHGGREATEVRFVTQKADDGQSVVICALWGERSSCDERGYRGEHNRRNDEGDGWASVEFNVRVPQGVRLEVTSVNGSLQVRGATSEVVAKTVNGSVRAETEGGPVRAQTVNGSIDARMSTVGDARDLAFESVNGSVTVAMPASLGAEVEMSTVNGRVNTEFPITVSGRIDPKRLRATIGDGSRRVRLKTVNGSVNLRRSE